MVRLMETINGRVICYTDGACKNNGRHDASAGFGVVFGLDHPWNYSGPVRARWRRTNNVAEIEAVIYAINFAANKGIERLLIRTDSRFLVNAYYRWIDFWISNGWMTANGDRVKNQPQFQSLLDTIDNHSEYMHVQFQHVRGHNGDVYNEEADWLATCGAEMDEDALYD